MPTPPFVILMRKDSRLLLSPQAPWPLLASLSSLSLSCAEWWHLLPSDEWPHQWDVPGHLHVRGSVPRVFTVDNNVGSLCLPKFSAPRGRGGVGTSHAVCADSPAQWGLPLHRAGKPPTVHIPGISRGPGWLKGAVPALLHHVVHPQPLSGNVRVDLVEEELSGVSCCSSDFPLVALKHPWGATLRPCADPAPNPAFPLGFPLSDGSS